MIKKLFLRLVPLMAVAVSFQSCSTNEDFLASKEETYNSNKFQVFTAVNNETVDYAKGFSLLYSKYRKLHPDFSSNLNRNSEDEKATVYFYLASQMFTTDDGSKAVIYPLVKADKVIGLVAGILNKEGDYVSYRVLSETTEYYREILNTFSVRLAKKLQQSTMMRPADECGDDVGGCGTIEPVTITPPRNIKGNDGGAGDNDPDPYSWNGNPDGGCGAFGDCGGGNNTGNPQQNQNPCAKLKAQNQNQGFKEKVAALDKTEMFNKDKETGYAAAYGTVPFEPMWNTPNGNVRLPDGNKYFGYMHTHLNMEGVVKIFSPYDVVTFLTSCVRNAQQSGNIADAYAIVITSQGNYTLKYSGDGSFNIGPNQIANWTNWYNQTYERLTSNQLADPAVLEKIFTQFLEEKVNISGIELYRTDKSTGNATKLKHNGSNNPVQTTPCPN